MPVSASRGERASIHPTIPVDCGEPPRRDGGGSALLVSDSRDGLRRRSAAVGAPAGAGERGGGRPAGRAGLRHRARNRAGVLHRRNPFPGRRHHAGGAVHRRPAREKGRRARADRSAPVPSRARPSQGQADAGPRFARLRREGSRPLQDAGGAERRHPAARRPAAGARSTSSRLRSRPTKRPSKPPRPRSIIPPSDRRATDASGFAWSIPEISCMPPTRDRSPPWS